MRLHIVMHESFEAPGAIIDWASKNECSITYTKLFQGDKLPSEVDDLDYLIVMGGPQSPDTTTEECAHFNAKAESDLIAKAIEAGKYVLGVCLGAQLIGEALGAKFEHSPNREIGVFNIQLTPEAKEEKIFSTYPEKFLVGHWHGDMPGLTPESALLATSEGCPRQIVQYTPKVYGFQCHFEFTKDSIEGMIQNCAHELEEYKGLPYVETAEQLRSHDYKPINNLLFNFLDAMKSDFYA